MRSLFATLALALLALAAPANAETFPSRTITLIVPYPPGGSTDVAGRIIADKMGAVLGQTVIVENVGGAGGSIGVGRLARALPDGYTIDIGQWDTHVGSIIYNLNYDLQTDFAPIGLVSINPQLLTARKKFPADDLEALVTWMKAHPGEAKFINQNASAQISALLLQKLTKTQLLLVPYRGAGPAMTDMLAGQVDLLVAQAAVLLPQIRVGAIKAMVNLSPQRSAVVPDIPSADEEGVSGLYMSGWFGLYAPKGTPADVIGKLNAAMVQALADPGLRKRFADLGLDIAAPAQQTPEGLAAFTKAEMDKWWPIIRESASGASELSGEVICGNCCCSARACWRLRWFLWAEAHRARRSKRFRSNNNKSRACRRCRSRSIRSCRRCSTKGARRAAPSSISRSPPATRRNSPAPPAPWPSPSASMPRRRAVCSNSSSCARRRLWALLTRSISTSRS